MIYIKHIFADSANDRIKSIYKIFMKK